MKILGIKLSHDACVSYIEDGTLVRHIELEKLNNRPRYTKMKGMKDLTDALEAIGVDMRDHKIQIAVDGWNNAHIREWNLDVAPYSEFDHGLRKWNKPVQGLLAGQPFTSYQHVTNHVLGAYAMSPAAAAGEPAHVLCWDGGMEPRLYTVNARGEMTYCNSLFGYYGIIYSVMGYYFGPYVREVEGVGYDQKGEYDWPGKLMSYIALGSYNAEFFSKVLSLFWSHAYPKSKRNFLDWRQTAIEEHAFCRAVRKLADDMHMDDASALLAIHNVIQHALVVKLQDTVLPDRNLIFTGGSALNIKWNSAIRRTGYFRSVFVPPCPNDCGNSIGAAVTHMMQYTGVKALKWRVDCGPNMVAGNSRAGWQGAPCGPEELAQLMCGGMWPIVVLRDMAEIGPRALGKRSIFAPANAKGAQAILNKIKRREEFRPVSPIVIESEAHRWFFPGTPDPYMLFDHVAKPHTADHEAPEVVHIDGTSRVQTVNEQEDKWLCDFLDEVGNETGVPIVCNTSANHNGTGFFSDLASAQSWAELYGVGAIYCNGTLYTNPNASIRG